MPFRFFEGPETEIYIEFTGQYTFLCRYFASLLHKIKAEKGKKEGAEISLCLESVYLYSAFLEDEVINIDQEEEEDIKNLFQDANEVPAGF